MKIVWTEPAVEDLRELQAYISRDSELYGSEFVERIISAVEKLADFPELGRIVPEANKHDIRELLYRSYRTFIESPAIALRCCRLSMELETSETQRPAPWEIGE